VLPVGIDLRDPRSQKRDLGHPSVSPFDIAEPVERALIQSIERIPIDLRIFSFELLRSPISLRGVPACR
jgi:hypothetical protein